MQLEFNGKKLEGLTQSDLDLEIRDGLEAMLGREPTDAELAVAWVEVAEQIAELNKACNEKTNN